MRFLFTRAIPLLFSALFVLGPFSAVSSLAGAQKTETAILAGGCFWCVESDYDYVPGVLETVSGYTGGQLANPTYKKVSAGGTGHYEAVKITYDPEKISYSEILDVFWRSVDPTDDGGQFCDRGASYKTAIFVTSEEQKTIAEASKKQINVSGLLKDPVVTPILPATTFYPAEDYHQNFYEKSPIRYTYYRFRCGRDARVDELWGDQARRGIMDH